MTKQLNIADEATSSHNAATESRDRGMLSLFAMPGRIDELTPNVHVESLASREARSGCRATSDH